RGEARVAGDDRVRWGPGRERAHQELEQVDRRGIGDDHLVGPGPDQAGQLGPDPPGRRHPGLSPAADQPPAPLRLDDLTQPRGGAPRQPAERVPVEVDDVRIVARELGAEARQLVARVQVPRVPGVGWDHRKAASIAERSAGLSTKSSAPAFSRTWSGWLALGMVNSAARRVRKFSATWRGVRPCRAAMAATSLFM